MKPTLTFLLLLLLAWLPTTARAQGAWHLELGGGKTINLDTDGGWNAGVGVGHDLPGGVQLYAHGAYHRLTSAANFVPIVTVRPASSDITDPTVPPGRTTFDENTSLYEGSLELRVISPGTVVAPFLSIQSGVYVLHFGDVPWEGTAPQPSWYVGYTLANETLVKGFAALGMGTEVSLGDRLALSLRANYARTFDGDYVFLPIISTIGIRL